MRITEPARKLLYRHEVLRAKLELKNHLLESVVRDIYEQTGQVLSLVRFRLATMEDQLNESFKREITDAGNLVGEAISRLRKMSKNLFPEQEILTDLGFIKALHEELQKDVHGKPQMFQVSGTPGTLGEERGVILLAILLSIISSIKSLYIENTLNLEIEYTETDICISINYRGNPIDLGIAGNLNENDLSANLSIQERLGLIGGNIITESTDNNTIVYQIKVPF